MGTKGSFGYKIGRKVRLMRVQYDADIFWQVLVREIYVLIKHYGSIEVLRKAFENLIDAKNKPTKDAIEKCKMFTDLNVSNKDLTDWYCLTRHCQNSFINILESGYFLNNGMKDDGFVFIIDFNENSVRFYGTDWQNKITEFEKATMNEIMEFEDMPTKSYTEIVSEMNTRYKSYYEKVEKVMAEIENINNIIKRAKELGSDQNILDKARILLYEMDIEKMKLDASYRFFYHRLEALNLIDHSDAQDVKNTKK
jgi:hypothetical protein